MKFDLPMKEVKYDREKWSKILLRYDIPDSIDDLLDEYEKAVKEPQPTYPEGITSFKDGEMLFSVSEKKRGYQEWCFAHLGLTAPSAIHSVRNSHGQELTVGMETNYGEIKKFEIFDNGVGKWMLAHFHNTAEPINFVHPAPPKLMTEDGHTVKDGDTLYPVSATPTLGEPFEYSEKRFVGGVVFKYFKERANAEAYIADNKKEFSRKQIREAAIPQCNIGKMANVLTINTEKLGL